MMAWWQRLAPRERATVAAGALILLLALGYVAVWEPFVQRQAALEERLAEARDELAWMRGAAAEVEALRAAGAGAATPPGDGRSLLNVVDETLRERNLDQTVDRLAPQGDGVSLNLRGAPFPRVVEWTAALRDAGIRVETLAVDARDHAGMVDVRVTVSRGTE